MNGDVELEGELAALSRIARKLLDDLGGGEYLREQRMQLILDAFDDVRQVVLSERPTQRLTRGA